VRVAKPSASNGLTIPASNSDRVVAQAAIQAIVDATVPTTTSRNQRLLAAGPEGVHDVHGGPAKGGSGRGQRCDGMPWDVPWLICV